MCFLFFVLSCYYLVFWFSSCFHCIFHLKLDVQLSLAILILIYYLSFTKCYFDASVFINLILKKKNNPVRLAQLLSFVVGWFFFSFLFIYLFIQMPEQEPRGQIIVCSRQCNQEAVEVAFKSGQIAFRGHVHNHFVSLASRYQTYI